MTQSVKFFGCWVLLLVSTQAFAGAYDELKPADQARVQKGEQVTILVNTNESAWPKMYIYERVEATPEEAAAVYADFELQASYMPRMTRSQITRVVDNARYEVAFDLEFSSGPESYTTANHIGNYDAKQSYRVDWTFVEGEAMRNIEGHARFEPLGTGTLVAYYSYVIPKSAFAGWVKDKAIAQIKGGAHAVVLQVGKERTSQPELLERQKQFLQNAVTPKSGYANEGCTLWEWFSGQCF